MEVSIIRQQHSGFAAAGKSDGAKRLAEGGNVCSLIGVEDSFQRSNGLIVQPQG